MSAVNEKNKIVVGFVVYFVSLSLLALFVYQWSYPKIDKESARAAAPKASRVQVYYENLGESAEDQALELMELSVELPSSDKVSAAELEPAAESDTDEESWD
jgi:hypothetical protein